MHSIERNPTSASFIDTNIVIYSLSQDEVKQGVAISLLSTKPVTSTSPGFFRFGRMPNGCGKSPAALALPTVGLHGSITADGYAFRPRTCLLDSVGWDRGFYTNASRCNMWKT